MDNTGAPARASLTPDNSLEEPASPFCGGDTEAQSCRGARPVGVGCQVTQRRPPGAPHPGQSPICPGAAGVDHTAEEVAV